MLAKNLRQKLKDSIPQSIKFYVKKNYLFELTKGYGYPISPFLSNLGDRSIKKTLIQENNNTKECLKKGETDKSPVYNYRIKSPKLKLLYFETPKNASSTIKTALFSIEHKYKYDPRYSMFMDFKKWQTEFPNMIVNWNEIVELPYLKFSFLRNPYERLLSGYLNTGWHFHHNKVTFENFIESLSDRVKTPASDIFNNHYKPFSYFIPKIGNNFFIDFIGKVETFHNDFKLILNACNVDIDIDRIMTRNKSKHTDYRSYYTVKTRKIVEDIYGEDIELGKYSF